MAAHRHRPAPSPQRIPKLGCARSLFGGARTSIFYGLGASLLVLCLSFATVVVVAQPPQDIHPWQTECGNYGCFVQWFCQPTTDLCQKCPDVEDGGGITEEDCRSMLVMADADGSALDDNNATDDAPITIGTTTYYTNATALQLDLESCIDECVKPQGGDACGDDIGGCDPGRFFCNYQSDAAADGIDANEGESPKEGVCSACPDDIRSCLNDPTIASPFGVEECVLCEIGVCVPLHFSVTTEINDGGEDVVVGSTALQGSPMMVAEGEIVSCNNLIYREELTCVSGGNDLPPEQTRQDGKICLVHDSTKNSYFVSVVKKCAAMGGVGVVMFQENSRVMNNETWTGSLSYLPTEIPSVVVSYDDGIRWEKERLGKAVRLNVTDIGDACIQRQFCSDEIPCVGSSAGQYCDYKWGGGNGGNGFCRDCPTDEDGNPDPLQCFFNTDGDRGKAMGQSGAESCSETCASSLTFPSCKFCPEDVSGFDFGLESDTDEKCRFCPENDLLYPDKEFPLFGEGVECWMVQKLNLRKFFDSVDVNANARNCELAQMMNYVCGCQGDGYLGANTEAKQAVLAWLPRVSAILSIIGSTFIIYDTVKNQKQRKSLSKKVNKQLLLGLSVFDILGAWGYVFTTLPIPEDHVYGPIYGAKGNEATCTAQCLIVCICAIKGFFIQLGTISAYMNVSLAVYYFLVIKQGWNDSRLTKIRWALFLTPIAVGLAWAFAGIKFYDSLNLWCNNTASYWPDIPVAIAIGVATIIMALVCWDVYKKEKASAKWRGGAAAVNSSTAATEQNESKRCCGIIPKLSRKGTSGGDNGRQSLSSQIFWQSFFYLLAFYLTWPPYLALQYAWAGGRSFTNYGLILTAATMVPLQGFWNVLVYLRPRYLQKRRDKATRTGTTSNTSTQTKSSGIWATLMRTKRRFSSGNNDTSNLASTDKGNLGSTDKKESEPRGSIDVAVAVEEEKQEEGAKNDSSSNHEEETQEEGEEEQ
ncbi:hypothetical protein ACHAXT_002064 [Thalassiosira profunda]